MIARRTVFAVLAVLALGPASARAQREAPLRVVRVTPSGTASPMSDITVTFDRPVAGSLDRTIDPATILSVVPAVRGRLEWRDPVTIRLAPSAPLAAGMRYTVTVANGFRAMDGSALASPHAFAFRAQGPTLLAGLPVGPGLHARHVTPTQRFDVVYSAPVDLPQLSSAAYVEFSAACGGQRIVRLSALGQRRIAKSDEQLNNAGGWQRDQSADSLRRIVRLMPASRLPAGCAGELVLPAEVDPRAPSTPTRWPFDTYGDLRLVKTTCGYRDNDACPTGPVTVMFSNPVRGAEVLRRVKLYPQVKFSVRDTSAESTEWTLDGALKPRVAYAIVADTAMRDVFRQPLLGNPALGYRTSGYTPAIMYPFGRQLIEREGGFRTLAVQHVNVDTLVAAIAPVPPTLEAAVLGRLAWSSDTLWETLRRTATFQRLPVRAATDRAMITGVKLPAPDASQAGAGTLFAVRVSGLTAEDGPIADGPAALLQVTDLGVHAKIGVAEGVVWVTSVRSGAAREGAVVSVHDTQGRVLGSARTDAEGIARFPALADPSAREAADENDDEEGSRGGFEGYVTATLGADRAITAINSYDPDLSSWRFNVASARGDDRIPLAGSVFTERGIYRPGERVYAKAIVRNGALGTLRAPAPGDSVKWLFHDREDGMLREVTTSLTAFGTSTQSLEVPAGAPIGEYRVEIQSKRLGRWRSVSQANYRVAEYRPPEFLVDLRAEGAVRLAGEKIVTRATARYLFGAPMGRAVVQWIARQAPVSSWELEIPGAEGWHLGDDYESWEDHATESDVFASRTDTLDVRGERAFTATLPASAAGRATRVTILAAVTDINRQVVGATSTTLVHPADFYVAAKPSGSWFWTAGTPQSVRVMAIRPDGRRVDGVRVQGTVVRREWHRVRRERNGMSELVGDWVTDTVARCTVTTAGDGAACAFTPTAGGGYTVTLTAADQAGRVAKTSLHRWATGAGWVPWSDETQFKMDVIPDRTKYSVGDTATVMFASPFTDAEAWITVEREGLIQQRRMRLTSGSTTLRLPITEAFAPNVFVSILVARGRSAPPGKLDDAGRPTIRVGYAELRVTPEVKRLVVTARPERSEYRPGDSARVRVAVRDGQGRGPSSEVTLWAVDEGVLALTGYTTPDPIDLLYRARGLGMRLASNMTSVAPQVPEGEKGRREAGGGGGADGSDILRSRFQTTAFFLGSVVTDAQGNAVASVKLPDNVTTFRVMAVAVTAGDRFGSGEAKLLVTRPLLARQALPRFVRPSDFFTAGAVINRRDGAEASVRVTAAATGVALRGDATQTATLAASRGAEVRFPFQAMRGDSASFRFDVTDDRDADAVRVTIPVRPDHHPVAHTIAGVLRDSATVELALPAGIDAERSRLSLNVGLSPLATIAGIGRELHVYPYYCTEQVISSAVPLIALVRARSVGAGDPQRRDVVRAVQMLSSRQRADGGIGYWSATDWTSPWLSAYAGTVLLDARDAGVAVDSLVLDRLAGYLGRELGSEATFTNVALFTPVATWTGRREIRLREQVAAVDFLSRLGRPRVASENELLRGAAQLTIEDRARLAEVLARRGQTAPARRLMESVWALVRVEGQRAVLAARDSSSFYFASSMRPVARILTATLAVEPGHALVGPLVETLAQQGRTGARIWWNTQDYASAVWALAAYDVQRKAQGERTVRIRAGGRVVLQRDASASSAVRDSVVSLRGLLSGASGSPSLRLSLDAGPGEGNVFYYLTVTEVPSAPPVTPEDRGIRVERWYERYDRSGAPTVTAVEGDLVRVRLRITVPTVRYFMVLDDALPAGLEAVDLSLRTAAALPGPGGGAAEREESEEGESESGAGGRWYGSWDSGWWSPFDHRELRDDRVVYSATLLWPGTYTATYLARATTPGTFIRPPAHAEEMYNPAVNGRSDGGAFLVTPRGR